MKTKGIRSILKTSLAVLLLTSMGALAPVQTASADTRSTLEKALGIDNAQTQMSGVQVRKLAPREYELWNSNPNYEVWVTYQYNVIEGYPGTTVRRTERTHIYCNGTAFVYAPNGSPSIINVELRGVER